MSTGYGWEGIRQVCATLLGARHVPERLCGGSVYLGRYNKCSTFTFTFTFAIYVAKVKNQKHLIATPPHSLLSVLGPISLCSRSSIPSESVVEAVVNWNGEK